MRPLPRRPTHPTKPPLDGISVLIVDDDTDACEALSLIVENYGGLALTASSAAEGRAALAIELPDVLLSDISMPREDGYAFIASVRALPRGAGGDVPAAAVTALPRGPAHAHALACGFQRVVQKPFDVSEILETVATLAARRSR